MTTNNLSSDVKSEFERVDRTLALEFGEYWRYTPVDTKDDDASQVCIDNFKAGEIYIITDLLVNLITDEVQTVELYKTALNKHEGRTRVSFDRFEANFTPVPKDEARAERQAQLKQIENDSKQIQAEIQLALSNPDELLRMIHDSNDSEIATQKDGLHFGIGLPSPESMASRNTTLIPEAGSSVAVDEQKKRFENQVSLGRMANRIATIKSKELSTKLSIASSIMMETAEAVKGKANDMLRKVDNVTAKIEIMKLYLGEDVEVQTIIDGALSTSRAPIKLLSCMVYMDEEIAVNRAFSDRDAFDHQNKGDFLEYLKATPSLVERLFPFERTMITIRPTRNTRNHYVTDSEWRAHNRANHSAFIMVRDGERISAIYSPIKFNKRLFPIASEMNAFFDGVFARSTNLVDKQREFKDLGDTYHGLVAVLQGVKDRQITDGSEVFGELAADTHGKSFLDERHIKINCDFVDEEDNLIGDNQENPITTLSQIIRTPLFTKGDIAIYSPRRYLNEDTTPSAFTLDNDGEYKTDWVLEIDYNDLDKLTHKRITLFKGEPSFTIALRKYGEKAAKNFRSFPTRANAALNLMAVRPSLIEKGLQSRRYREDLFDCGLMPFIVEARCMIAHIQAQTAGIKEALKGYYPNLSDDDLHLMIMDWYRNYDGTAKINVKAATTKIVNDYQKGAAFNQTTIKTATAHLIEIGDEPMYASKLNGELFIISYSKRLINSFPLKFGDKKYPFFALNSISPEGKIISTTLIGSEAQSYPVSQILHTETVSSAFDKEVTERLSIRNFEITDNRYNGAEFVKLNKTATANRKRVTDTLTRVERCMEDKDDELTMEFIRELVEELDEMKPHVKRDKKSVSFGLKIAPFRINEYSKRVTYTGVGINIPRLIKYLYERMSPIGRSAFKSEIEDLILDSLLFSRALSKIDNSREGFGDFLGIYSDELTAGKVATLIYSETRALANVSSIKQEIDWNEKHNKKGAGTIAPFVTLLKQEADAPNLFKESGL